MIIIPCHLYEKIPLDIHSSVNVDGFRPSQMTMLYTGKFQ